MDALPAPLAVYHKSIVSARATTVLYELTKNTPAVSLGAYVDYLVGAFGLSFSSSFGGSKWEAIAKCLQGFVNGAVSASVMLDTSFTLSHNTGPIYNKGMFYLGSTDLIHTLDTQRAGLIPNFVHSVGLDWVTTEGVIADGVLLGEDFTVPVDYQLVMDLGSVDNYSDNVSEFNKAKKENELLVAKTVYVNAKTYQINPQDVVTVVTRAEL